MRSQKTQTEHFIENLLNEGPMPTWYVMREVKEERRKRGLVGTTSEEFTKAEAQRARRRLGVKVISDGQGTWSWVLQC